MRDLIVTQNITLDGVVEATEGWFGVAGEDRELVATVAEHRAAADAFLTGRLTFESMRGFWPHQAEDTTGISDYLNAVPKYVVSRTLTNPEWENSTVLRGDLRGEIEALKAAPGRDIVTTGSITLVHDLIRAGLVDEYRLFVYPVVLGRGRRLFDGERLPPLRLAETRAHPSGVVLLRHRVA